MNSAYQVVHNVVNPSDWPSPVKQIAQALGHPLPTSISSGPYPCVSNGATALLPELSCSPALRITTNIDSHPLHSRPLTDVFDVVLSTVAELRALVKLNDDGGPRPTVPLWSSLIQALGQACSKDASVLTEVPFVLARTATRKLGELEGIATVLVCHVNSIDISPSHSQASVEDIKFTSICTNSSDNGNMMNDNISIHDMDESSPTTSTVPSINVPFNAHVLPGRGRRCSAVLPVICVADEDNMSSLLTSILYQRRVWGIDEPAVGIVFSKTGVFGQVVLGWLDVQLADDDQNLPVVHIASATANSISHPSLGVFDLTEPASTFFLAQFILGLNSHFHKIVIAASRSRMNPLHWRSDIFPDDPEIDKPLEGRVAQWARGVMLDDSSDDSSSCPQTPSPYEIPVGLPPSPVTSMPSDPLPDILKEDDDRDRPRGIPARLKSSNNVKEEGPNLNTKTSKKKGKPRSQNTGSQTDSAISSSSFGRRSAQGLKDQLTISTWLFERYAFTIGRIKLDDRTPDAMAINAMIDLYDQMTDFRWPTGWSTLDALPRVDESVREIREHLFRQYEELGYKDIGQKSGTALTAAQTSVVSDRLSSLLSAVIGAFAREAAAKGRPVYEAERRHDWDAILYRFYVVPGEVISSSVLLEKALNFPRNNAIDETNPDVLISLQQKLANDYFHHCAAAATLTNARDVRDQALAALNQANTFQSELESLSEDALRMTEAIQKRAAREPVNGVCDAILVTPISNPLGDGDDPTNQQHQISINDFGLVRHPQRIGKSQRTDSTDTQTSSKPSASFLSLPLASSGPSSPSSKLTTDQKKLLHNPFRVACTESIPTSNLKELKGPNYPVGFDDLLLPIMIAEYKKRDDKEAKAVNQGRTYCVSAVTFLSSLGIKEYPVFGLITSGKIGGIIVAWHSKSMDKIYIMERNIRTYDLSSPLQAFQFATFLIRLREHSKGLESLFGVFDKSKRGQLERWTKQAQNIEMGSNVRPVDFVAGGE